LHRFSWHASHGGSRGEEKRPNALQFQKLALMPDQMYHDVRDVRTADDAVLTIRLMIFFELVDIDRMLETTHDPIGDFINAATSDVVEFTGKRSFDQFKQETDKLNDSATYTQLLHRAKQCGYQVNNVVYRGYGAPDSLQAMHDEAIQSRTRLQLERATEEQAQDLEDYRLSCQMERSERRRSEQLTEVQHDLEVKRQQAEAEIKRKERQENYRREQKRAADELLLRQRHAADEQTQSHLAALREMQVDLTQYLTQSRADQVIEVRGSSDVQPELHFTSAKQSSES
jgi:regulator of protease activity HflC (stomatin/prohibitin superfamily)